MWLILKSRVGFREDLPKCVCFRQNCHCTGLLPNCDKRTCHAKYQRRSRSRMCSPPTLARCSVRTIFGGLWARLPALKDDWGTCTLNTLSFPVLCVLLTRTSIRRPLKCGAPMACVISSKYLQMRRSQAVRPQKNFGEYAWVVSQGTLGFSLESRVSLMIITMLVALVPAQVRRSCRAS